jgi:hypothetical protein
LFDISFDNHLPDTFATLRPLCNNPPATAGLLHGIDSGAGPGGLMKTARGWIVGCLGVAFLLLASFGLAQTPSGSPANDAVAFPGGMKPPDSVTLPAPRGAVKFDHAAHVKIGKCVECHHASKPQKPAKSQFEKCGDCHTRAGSPQVKVKLQGAFHNPQATAGTCIDCHKRQNAAGKEVPTKCAECHKKA